jgi:hypothetical protein
MYISVYHEPDRRTSEFVYSLIEAIKFMIVTTEYFSFLTLLYFASVGRVVHASYGGNGLRTSSIFDRMYLETT